MPSRNADADASQKPIDPSSLSVTEALAGTFVAKVFQFAKQNTVTPKVLNDAVGLMFDRTGIAQIQGASRAPLPPPSDDSSTTTASTAQEIWTAHKKAVGDKGVFLLNIAALGNNENGKHTSVQKVKLSALGRQLVASLPNLRAGKGKTRRTRATSRSCRGSCSEIPRDAPSSRAPRSSRTTSRSTGRPGTTRVPGCSSCGC
jgi:hypothetical protein